MSSQAIVTKEESKEVPSKSSTSSYTVIKDIKNVNMLNPSLVETHISNVYSDSKPVIVFSRQRIFKIIVIGNSGVGKTCLTLRFCIGKFPEKTEATIGVDFREKNLDIGEETVKIQIWDTAGQERFRQSMVPHYYRNVHAVIFVYDITNRLSFENLRGWIEECNAHNLGPEVPRILVGNKCDAVEKCDVPTHEAQCFADRYCMPLFETSAKDDSVSDHVESIFLTVAHKLKNSRPMMMSTDVQSDDMTLKPESPLILRDSSSFVPAEKSTSGNKCFC